MNNGGITNEGHVGLVGDSGSAGCGDGGGGCVDGGSCFMDGGTQV
jgi:hypothetical protein